jgi:hypothetical protein
VSRVAAVTIGEGFGIISHLARLTLTYDGSGGTGPATLVAKVPTASPANRRIADALGAYPREVAFYREMAAHSPLPAPTCYYAALDQETGDSILLLEDLSAARTVDPVAGCAPADAATTMLALSRLHAAWWDSARLNDFPWVRAFGDPRVAQSRAMFFQDAWPRFLERHGDSIPAAAHAAGAALAGRMEDVVVRVGGRPQTICHGDFRLDNLFFDLPDHPITAIDWQLCSRASGLVDVAAFLIYDLDVATRRTHERELLRRYHEALCVGGVTGYSFEHCLEDYRWALLYWYIRPVSAAVADPGTARGEALFTSFPERYFAATADWDTGALLNG